MVTGNNIISPEMDGLQEPTTSFIDHAYVIDKTSGSPDHEKICRTGCLCLQISNSKFSFCIYDTLVKRFTVFESYDIQNREKELHPMSYIRNLTDEIDSFFRSSEWFKHHYQSVHCIFDNMKSTLVPLVLYDTTKKDLYLRFNQFLDHTEEITTDKLEELEAINIYALPSGFSEMLLKYFPYARISHVSSILLKSLFGELNEHSPKSDVFLNFRSSFFDIVLFEKKNLGYFNSFPFPSNEDFIYYFLFVIDQLKIAANAINAIITGEIDKNATELSLLRRYVKNVSFLGDEHYRGTKFFSNYYYYYFYTLLKSNLCEL